MFQLACGAYYVDAEDGGVPDIYAEYSRHAKLVVERDLKSTEGKAAYCAVSRNDGWPFLVIAFRYSPTGAGFNPGVLIVPESDLLFLGAGTLLMAFDLLVPDQIWEDTAQIGFWSWRLHDEVVLMSAELELAAWNTKGRKLWSMPVEPPWSYTVENNLVKLDVMNQMSEFPLDNGPGRN